LPLGRAALAQHVEAKIVYTPAHVSILGFQPLDLNHDGKVNFYFRTFAGGTSTAVQVPWNLQSLLRIRSVEPGRRPGFQCDCVVGGERIGPRRRFSLAGDIAGVYWRIHSGHTTFKWFGQWGNSGKGLKNRYLGLRFFINGKLHYRWARVSVFINGGSFSPPAAFDRLRLRNHHWQVDHSWPDQGAGGWCSTNSCKHEDPRSQTDLIEGF
jgi:hypothetical protein